MVSPPTPKFRLHSDVTLILKCSKEAEEFLADSSRRRDRVSDTPSTVEAAAKVLCRQHRLSIRNEKNVLPFTAVQFGKYMGQTFWWLLENDPGCVVYILSGHVDNGTLSNLNVNKNLLERQENFTFTECG